MNFENNTSNPKNEVEEDEDVDVDDMHKTLSVSIVENLIEQNEKNENEREKNEYENEKERIEKETEYYVSKIKITNLVLGGRLNLTHGKTINIEKIARDNPSIKLQRTVFSAIVFILDGNGDSDDERNISCSLYSNARFTSMGARNQEEALKSVYRQVLHINKFFGIDCTCKGIYIANVVAAVKVPPIDIDELLRKFPGTFPPRTDFPGVYYKTNPTQFHKLSHSKKCQQTLPKERIAMGIFATGWVTLMGGDNENNLTQSFRHVFSSYIIHCLKTTK